MIDRTQRRYAARNLCQYQSRGQFSGCQRPACAAAPPRRAVWHHRSSDDRARASPALTPSRIIDRSNSPKAPVTWKKAVDRMAWWCRFVAGPGRSARLGRDQRPAREGARGAGFSQRDQFNGVSIPPTAYVPCTPHRTPAGLSSDVAFGDPGYADTSNSCPKRSASEGHLRRHAVGLRKRSGRHGLRRRCDC